MKYRYKFSTIFKKCILVCEIEFASTQRRNWEYNETVPRLTVDFQLKRRQIETANINMKRRQQYGTH